MACNWNINSAEPDPETRTIRCRCRDCGRSANLDCDRDFGTGELVVQVRTCVEKGGYFELPTSDSAPIEEAPEDD